MRNLTFIDRLVCHADNALRTLVPGVATPERLNPASSAAHTEFDAVEQKHAAGLMRINHTGEVCAQALYQGQALTARLPDVRDAMDEAAIEEIDHLVWCEERLRELDSRPSLLNPLFYGLSYSIGALAGIAGDKWSLGFVAATEEQVCKHLDEHMHSLPEQDARSRAILQQMLIDERKHATVALEAGGVQFPAPVKQAMSLLSKVMTGSTYRI